MAYSGRCLLSGYFNHRNANQGSCTNACRWKYGMDGAGEDVSGDVLKMEELQAANPSALSSCGDLPRHPLADEVYLLTEEGRPGEQMPVFEDEHGTYIMNSKDLRAIEHVERLVKIGIDSLKIEGRTKSHYYVARTAQLYRQAIDDALAGREFDWTLMRKLDGLASRGYTDGFYQRRHTAAHQNYEQGASLLFNQRFVGEVTSYDKASGEAEILVKNKFSVGDSIELIDPNGNHTFDVASMQQAETGVAMDVAPGSGHRVKIKLPVEPSPYALLAKNIAPEEEQAAA
jgi:putative protease